MIIDKNKLLEISKTKTISELAKMFYVSYGTMYKALKQIGYVPKKRGRKTPKLIIK